MDAQVLGDRIRLIWTPPPPDGLGPLTFAVVRKRNGVLQHPADGTRIAEVGTCEFDDTLLTPGETVGYAVLSRRGGVDSVGAISLGPFVFLADVKDVRVEVRDHEAELTWSPPRGIAEVRVIRKRGGPPANPKDGDRIASALDHALDRNIDPGQDYHYGIYAIYRMPDGRLFPSPGIVVTARPQPTVAVPEAPRLLQEPTGRVRIDWIEPVRGSIRILRTPHPLPLPAGSRLTAADARALDGHWIEPAAPDRAYDPDPPRIGLSYYTPVAGWGDTWTVGQGSVLSRVPDPSELRAPAPAAGWARPPAASGSRSDGDGTRKPWPRWSSPDRVRLPRDRAIRSRPRRTSPARITTARTAGRSAYRRPHSAASAPRPGGATGRPPSRSRPTAAHGTSGFTASPSGTASARSRRAWSRRRPRSCPALTRKSPCRYHLKRPLLPIPGLPWSLTFRTEPAGSVLPAMVVVAHPRTVPLSVDDGEIVARLPAVRNGARFSIRTPFNLAGHGVRVFPDPGVEPDAQIPIRFRHPETGSTRV